MKQRKCPGCQAPLLEHETTCPNCGAEVKARKRKGPRCRCQECGAKFRAEGAQSGSMVECPKCGQPVKVPRPESIAYATTLASKESRSRKKLGPGWDVTYDGLDRLYFYGIVAGFTLLAWMTCIVVLGIVLFGLLSGIVWAPYVLLIGLTGFIVRHAMESDEDMRFWGAYIALGWLVAIPVLGLFVTLGIVLLGFGVLTIAMIMAGIRLLKCLAIPAESNARPFIIGGVLLLGVGLLFFFAAGVQTALNITSLLNPTEIPYLEPLLLSGILVVILANCLFAIFLRLIPAFLEDSATSEATTNYLIYVFAFAVAGLVLTGLLHSGVLVGSGIGMDQMGPNIARIVFLTLVGINVYLLLKSMSAVRDNIGHHLR